MPYPWALPYLIVTWPTDLDEVEQQRRTIKTLVTLHIFREEPTLDRSRCWYLVRGRVEEDSVDVKVGFAADSFTEQMLRNSAYRIPDEILDHVERILKSRESRQFSPDSSGGRTD